jgi:hypothetical protein
MRSKSKDNLAASAADKWCPLAVVGEDGVAFPERGAKGLGGEYVRG